MVFSGKRMLLRLVVSLPIFSGVHLQVFYFHVHYRETVIYTLVIFWGGLKLPNVFLYK